MYFLFLDFELCWRGSFAPVLQRFFTKAPPLEYWILVDFPSLQLPVQWLCAMRYVFYVSRSTCSVCSCWTRRCHKTDWLSEFILLSQPDGIVWASTGSHKWQVESSQLRDVSSVEFTCGNNFTRWCMMIVARSSIQIVSLTLNQISWCSDGILSQSQMSLLASAAEEPLRNLTKRSTSAKFETRKMKSTWYQLLKTSKIIEKLHLSTKLWWFEKS